MDRHPSGASHRVRRTKGLDKQAWVKKADWARVQAEVDGTTPPVSEHEIEQRRMAHWLNTGTTLRTTLRPGQHCDCKACS